MNDGSYYNTREYLLKKYSEMSTQERKDKREDFERLRRFHALTGKTCTVAYYKRLIGILDEAEKETSSLLARS